MNLLLLLVLGAIWGTSFMFIKVVVAEVPPFALVTGRLGMAALAMWGLARLRGDPFPRERRLWATYVVTGLFNGALPFSLISWGEQYIPSGLASLLQATTPIFTVILAHFLTQDDRIHTRKLLGIGLGFLGVGVLLWPELRAGLSASLWGMLAIVGSSASYAVATIFARHRLKGQPAFTSAAGQFTMGFAFIALLYLVSGDYLTSVPSTPVLASWLALVLLGSVAAYTIYYTLLARAEATFVNSVTFLVPINGLLLGALVLGEPLDWTIILSLALVFTGVLLVRGRKQET